MPVTVLRRDGTVEGGGEGGGMPQAVVTPKGRVQYVLMSHFA